MPPSLGLYVHVPFCLTRCGYCDCNTYTSGDRGAYVADPRPAPWRTRSDAARSTSGRRRRASARRSSAAGREAPDAAARRMERVMLELRLAEGLATDLCDPSAPARLRDGGLLTADAGHAVLTLRGRQLADHVVRELA